MVAILAQRRLRQNAFYNTVRGVKPDFLTLFRRGRETEKETETRRERER